MSGAAKVKLHELRGQLGDKSFRLAITEFSETTGETFTVEVHVTSPSGTPVVPTRVLDGSFSSLFAAKVEGLHVALAMAEAEREPFIYPS